MCRVSGGTTKRVNSVNPTQAGAALGSVLPIAERVYAEHRLPTRFRLTPLAAPECDAMLADAGYARIDESLTLIAALSPRAPDPAVTVAPRPDAAWLDGMADANGWAADQIAAHRATIERMPAGSGFATVDLGSGPVAFGAAGIGELRACLFDIVVVPAARGRGIGRRLVAGLLGWAAAQGHAEALLQVLAANHPARALYASLGFVEAYPYHYRVAPG